MADQKHDWLPDWFWDSEKPDPPCGVVGPIESEQDRLRSSRLRQQVKMLNFGSIYGGPNRIGTIKSFNIAGSIGGGTASQVSPTGRKPNGLPDSFGDEFSPVPASAASLIDPTTVKLVILKGHSPPTSTLALDIDYSKAELAVLAIVEAMHGPRPTPPEGNKGDETQALDPLD